MLNAFVKAQNTETEMEDAPMRVDAPMSYGLNRTVSQNAQQKSLLK